MTWPNDARGWRLWVPMLLFFGASGFVGSVLGQLLGTSVALGALAVIFGVTGVVLNWRARQRRTGRLTELRSPAASESR